MTEAQFNTTKNELRHALEKIAEAVKKGELEGDQAKIFRPQIKELWLMESLEFEGYSRYVALKEDLNMSIELLNQDKKNVESLKRILSLKKAMQRGRG